MEKTFVNCTPHDIRVVLENGKEVIFPGPGKNNEARVSTVNVQCEPINGIPSYRTEYGELVNLPEPKEGVMYIVSAMVFAATDRKDIVAPATNMAIRDENNRIIGVPGFIVK